MKQIPLELHVSPLHVQLVNTNQEQHASIALVENILRLVQHLVVHVQATSILHLVLRPVLLLLMVIVQHQISAVKKNVLLVQQELVAPVQLVLLEDTPAQLVKRPVPCANLESIKILLVKLHVMIVLVVPNHQVVLRYVLHARQQNMPALAHQLAHLSPMDTKDPRTNVVNKNVLLEVQELVALARLVLLELFQVHLAKRHVLHVLVEQSRQLVPLLARRVHPINTVLLVLQSVPQQVMVMSQQPTDVPERNVLLEVLEQVVCVQLALLVLTQVQLVKLHVLHVLVASILVLLVLHPVAIVQITNILLLVLHLVPLLQMAIVQHQISVDKNSVLLVLQEQVALVQLVVVELDLLLAPPLVILVLPISLLLLVLHHVQLLQMVTNQLQINVDKKNVRLELQEPMVCARAAQRQLIKMNLVKQVANNVQLVLHVARLE